MKLRGDYMFGSVIKNYLEENGISQRFLCDKTGISTATMNAMLNGNRKIEVTEYFSICNALQKPVDYFANCWKNSHPEGRG